MSEELKKVVEDYFGAKGRADLGEEVRYQAFKARMLLETTTIDCGDFAQKKTLPAKEGASKQQSKLNGAKAL